MVANISLSIVIILNDQRITLWNDIHSVSKDSFAKEIEFILVGAFCKEHQEIFQSFQQKFVHVRLISETNESVARRRNRARAVAQGEYLTFMNEGDHIELNSLWIIKVPNGKMPK